MIMIYRIKQIRTEHGYTQEELAKKVGVTKSTISEIENNKKSPRVTTLMKIAKALDCEIDSLIMYNR